MSSNSPMGSSAPEADKMNDPAYDTHANRPHADVANSEPDHCRICRSEGTPHEPLYHPCKCSGSIKFVHQDCLMEWLTHSQKKYCELCKTPFTFTKVYDPDMPNSLPTPLFVRQLTRRLARCALRFLRGLLVTFVWLGCLPWCVRWMWRGWFWVSDGGWWQLPAGEFPARPPTDTQQTSTTTSAAGHSAFFTPSALSAVVSAVTEDANLTPTNLDVVASAALNASAIGSNYPDGIFFDRNPFFNATRFQFVNNLIVDVIEGQLLTALIVVTFIIVFLIREWVVQQQPALPGDAANIPLLNELENALAGEEAAELEALAVLPQAPVAVEQVVPVEGAIEADEDARDERVPERDTSGEEEETPRDETDVLQHRVIAQPRKRRRVLPTDAEPGSSSSLEAIGDGTVEESGESTVFNFADLPLRPTPTRENTSQVAGLRRELEETTRSASANAQYDFGGTGGSTDNLFQFEGGNPDASRLPDIWSQATSSGAEISDRLETIDAERSAHWMRENTSSAPDSPAPSEQRTSESGIALGSHNNDIDDESGSASRASSSSFEIIGAPKIHKGKGVDIASSVQVSVVEGKGKEVAPVGAQLDGGNNSVEGYGDEDEMRTEGSLGVGTSEWSTAAHAGDAPSESSATPPMAMPPPPPMPPYLDPLDVHLDAEGLGDALAIEALQEHVLARERDPQAPQNRLAERQRDTARAAAAVQEPPPLPPPLPPLPPPALPVRRAGLFDWIIGEDDAQNQRERNANEDDDTDDEDPPVGAAAAVPQGILDDEAADDFEGIMELVGMRGPLIGLVQNAAISSMLITATVAIGVTFPYVAGKTVMVVLAHPVLFFFQLPMKVVSFCAEFLVDFSTMVAFSLLLMAEQAIRAFLMPASSFVPGLSGYLDSGGLTNFLMNWAVDGQTRVVAKFASIETTYMAVRKLPATSMPPLSLVMKENFGRLADTINCVLGRVGLASLVATEVSAGPKQLDLMGLKITNPLAWAVHTWEDAFAAINLTRSLNGTVETTGYPSNSQEALTYAGLYQWSAWDRVGAVLLGYAFFTIAGMVYVKRRRQQPPGPVERLAAEFLQQCGGVMKVVLIIGIEMFVFPLYCGVLLDIAMLPLFETATVASRIQFAVDFPFTNVFVHWFVGTCYMFHFALFVSMCRKIMRTGVLYFIRDPDDPNFHPVRDVLNRPVVTQLRKIGFSAFIYGVLVLMCLGGVVWGLHGVTRDVLPIHWSSNEPVFEFPVDLLFYNFLMPLAVKFFKPSDGLQNMYGWWFKKCARALRLSSFMFDKRHADEEGYTVYPTWTSFFFLEKPDYDKPIMPGDELPANQIYFRRDGRFVRAPASDSVRRPKGTSVFIPVDEQNRRLDVSADQDPPDGPTGANSSDWRLAYIPPFFRVRIGIIVVGIWIFAAVTGVSFTIGPLLVGRLLLRQLVPTQVRLNDIYAFSVGVYVLGCVTLCLSKVPSVYKSAKAAIQHLTRAASNASHPEKMNNARLVVADVIVRSLKIGYVLTAFAIVMPTLVALIIEFYFIIPLHTAFGATAAASVPQNVAGAAENLNSTAASTVTAAAPPDSRLHLEHTIHFVQDWTLGVLYVKMLCKMVLLDDNNVWARSLRGIVAPGWLNPDAKLATRVFIAPCVAGMLVALSFPVAMARLLVVLGIADGVAVYRFAFPVCLLGLCISAAGYALYRVVEGWKEGVRDEVYLRGMRIHNHGEEASVVRGRVGDVAK